MNDLTIEQTADDLAKQGLGPAGLGAEAKQTQHSHFEACYGNIADGNFSA